LVSSEALSFQSNDELDKQRNDLIKSSLNVSWQQQQQQSVIAARKLHNCRCRQCRSVAIANDKQLNNAVMIEHVNSDDNF